MARMVACAAKQSRLPQRSARMLLDILPLCLYHNLPMILAQETRHPRRFLEQTYHWFSCPVQGCYQRYDMGHGYYVMRENAIEDQTNKLPCPECSFRLYLAKRDASLENTLWLCANEECPSNKRRDLTRP